MTLAKWPLAVPKANVGELVLSLRRTLATAYDALHSVDRSLLSVDKPGARKMQQLFAGAYLVTKARQSDAERPGPVVLRFYNARKTHEFPYDLGDDPAFFSARYHNGPVTWGVCRPDVRRIIQRDNWMVFFSAEKDDRKSLVTHYRFSAALRVARKISHQAIFTNSSDSLFRDYLNLLVRPQGGYGWEHYEPCLRTNDWHDDWLWRLSEPLPKPFCKDDFVMAGEMHRSGTPLTINGQPAPIATSYIIFSNAPEDTMILQDPPHVATHRKGEPYETWNSDARSMLIRRLVFGDSPERCLRTPNRQPHRHIHRQLDDSNWAERLRAAIH